VGEGDQGREHQGELSGRAASCQATADPIIILMKSRRRIAILEAPTTPFRVQLQRDLRPTEWGSSVILRGNNPQDRMSALGVLNKQFQDVALSNDHILRL
jgi:hypothetical protein